MKSTNMYLGRFLIFAFLSNLLIVFSATSWGAGLGQNLAEISRQVKDISQENTSHKQAFSFVKSTPYSAELTLIEVKNKNGKSKTHTYSFNLSDLDENLIRYESSSKEISVVLPTKKEQKTIKKSTNGESKNYVNKIQLIARDIDNARAIIRAFKAIIPQAELSWKKSIGINFKDFTQVRTKLNGRKSTINERGKTIEQTISSPSSARDKLRVEHKIITKKGDINIRVYEWSMADVLPHSLTRQTGKNISISANISRKQKLVAVSKNDIQQNYSNKIKIYAHSADEARLLQQLLKSMITPSRNILNTRLNKSLNAKQQLQLISQNVTSFEGGKLSYKQSITANCNSIYSQESISKNGKSQSSVYSFNFGLLNPTSPQITIKGKNLGLSLRMRDKNKYVKQVKNGTNNSYSNKVQLVIEDLDSARAISQVLPDVIKFCDKPIAARNINWVKETLLQQSSAGPDLKQEIVSKDNKQCSFSFSSKETRKNKILDNLYKFNLRDINHRNIEIKTGKSQVSLTLGTKYGEKIIKHYSGEKANYVAGVKIALSEVENARIMQKTFENLIEKCQ